MSTDWNLLGHRSEWKLQVAKSQSNCDIIEPYIQLPKTHGFLHDFLYTKPWGWVILIIRNDRKGERGTELHCSATKWIMDPSLNCIHVLYWNLEYCYTGEWLKNSKIAVSLKTLHSKQLPDNGYAGRRWTRFTAPNTMKSNLPDDQYEIDQKCNQLPKTCDCSMIVRPWHWVTLAWVIFNWHPTIMAKREMWDQAPLFDYFCSTLLICKSIWSQIVDLTR